ncbi:MAG: hypothetical protein AAF826_10895 [Pseudomonadota bacterium]
MTDIYSRVPHFEAEVKILTPEEGGRNLPPYNYIRWDFGYADKSSTDPIYMIYPNFLGGDGQPIAKGVPLHGIFTTRMHIVADCSVIFHKSRISIGTEFNCHEGRHVVATGVVTRLLALKDI